MGIMKSRRIVDMRNALTDEQKKRLGGTRRLVSKESLGSCCECGRDDEPDPDFEPYEQYTPNGFLVEDKLLSAARKGQGDDEVLKLIRDMFEEGYKLERRPNDSIVIDMSIAINMLESDKKPLMTFLSNLKRRDD